MHTASVTWSPDLHTIIRQLKKNQENNVSSLSNVEKVAIDMTFSKNSVHKSDEVKPLVSWG